MTAPLGPRLVSGTVIKAAGIAGSIAEAPLTQKVVTGLAENKAGKWGADQVENIAGRIVSAPIVQEAAAKAEALVTNVLGKSPVARDLAVGLFKKVRSFINESGLKSPPVKAFQMGEDALETLQSGGTFLRAAKETIGKLHEIHLAVKPEKVEHTSESLQEAFELAHHTLASITSRKPQEEMLQDAKVGIKLLEDTISTPRSANLEIQDTEIKAKILGVELKAADNMVFAQNAFTAIIKMNSQGIELPKIRLSNIFPNDEMGHADKGFTNHETMPGSKLAIFFNAKADWQKVAETSKRAFAAKWQLTSSPQHPIYHSVGRTMYNGAAGNDKLVKSNKMLESQRLKIQEKAGNIETPQDFMGEIFAHIMVNGYQPELIPHYNTYKDWGGKFPKDFLPAGQSLPLQPRPLPQPPQPFGYLD